MTILTRIKAKHLIDAGKGAQVGIMYEEHNNTTYGVLNNYEAQRTDHYPIGHGDLRGAVSATTPTFDQR